MASDVSHCVRVTLILIKFVLSKCRKLEISLKSIEHLFQNTDCTELASDKRTLFNHSGTHLTSLAEFVSSPFQDGGNEIHFIQIQRLFSDKHKLIAFPLEIIVFCNQLYCTVTFSSASTTLSLKFSIVQHRLFCRQDLSAARTNPRRGYNRHKVKYI